MRLQRGFTLVEVMVALTIVALALAGAAISMSQMASNASSLRDRTYASWIAQNKITEMRLSGESAEVDITSGELDYAGSTWAWEADVSETGVENLFRVDVSVGYAGQSDYVRTVTGFIGEPTPPGVGALAWEGRPGRGENTE
ncbi:MAG: type II secretion system minor pseudopilin GspI [Pseudomonadota bacterium]